MFSRSHSSASTGVKPQLVGQEESNLHDRKAKPLMLIFKSLLDGLFSLAHMSNRIDRHALRQGDAVESGEHLANPDRVASHLDVTPVGGCLGNLTRQSGWGHLAAGHAVNGVVNENNGYILPAGGSVHCLGGADSGEVAVSLIGKHRACRGGRASRRSPQRARGRAEPRIISQLK